jgi:hypothetical protein
MRELMAHVAEAAIYYPEYRYRVWGYGEWIAMEGLLAAARICQNPRYLGFVEGLVTGYIDGIALPGSNSPSLFLNGTGSQPILTVWQQLSNYCKSISGTERQQCEQWRELFPDEFPAA